MKKSTLAIWFCLSALATASASGASLTISWTAPGDDGNQGIAAGYDLRYAAVPINEANWQSAARVDDLPAPAHAGSVQSVTIDGLDSSHVYYFAMRAVDEAGNWSTLSDNVGWTFCECDGYAGNVNGDPLDQVNIADLDIMVSHLFRGLVAVPCPAEADINQDIYGTINILDLQALVSYLFRSEPNAIRPCN